MKERDDSLLAAAMLLLIAFVSLEVFLRFDMEYDLVRGHVPLKSYDGAPIYPFIAAIVLIAAVVGGLTFLFGLAMLARARASAGRMALALIPALLVLGIQYLTAAIDEYERTAPTRGSSQRSTSHRKPAPKAGPEDEASGAEWASATELLNASACNRPGHSARFVEGCQRYVARQVGNDSYTLGEAGAAWAAIHHIQNEDDCRSSTLPDYEEHPFFVASCKRQVSDEDRHRGESWARTHSLRAEKDCEAGQPAAHPEFLAGCRAAITAMRFESTASAK